MRILALALPAAAVLAFAAFSARAEDAAPAPAPKPAPAAAPEDLTPRVVALEADISALRAEVQYLRSRETDLTTSMLNMLRATANLHAGTAQCRDLGFEHAAISANSRQALLSTLDALGHDLSDGLPVVTRQQQDLKRHAADLERAAGWTDVK